MTTYDFTHSGDFGGSFDSSQFHEELAADGQVGPKFLHVSYEEDTGIVTVHTSSALAAGEETQLNSLVAAHVPGPFSGGSPPGFDDLNLSRFFASQSGISSTTSTNWKTYLTMQETFPAGQYRFLWGYVWRMTKMSGSKTFTARLVIDGTPVGEPHVLSMNRDKTYYRWPAHAFSEAQVQEGLRTVEIQFARTGNGNATAYMYEAQLEALKVSD